MDIQVKQRKSLMLNRPFHGRDSFIEVTEWSNGEGYDITIDEQPVISLHYSDLDLINTIVGMINLKTDCDNDR